MYSDIDANLQFFLFAGSKLFTLVCVSVPVIKLMRVVEFAFNLRDDGWFRSRARFVLNLRFVQMASDRPRNFITAFVPERVHTSANCISRPCSVCKAQLAVDASYATRKVPAGLYCHKCAAASQFITADHAEEIYRSELLDQLRCVLDGAPSQIATPTWQAIFEREDMKSKQPQHVTTKHLLVHMATSCGNHEVLRICLQRWPESVNAKTEVSFAVCVFANVVLQEGETPLHTVFSRGPLAVTGEARAACLRVLIEFKANVKEPHPRVLPVFSFAVVLFLRLFLAATGPTLHGTARGRSLALARVCGAVGGGQM